MNYYSIGKGEKPYLINTHKCLHTFPQTTKHTHIKKKLNTNEVKNLKVVAKRPKFKDLIFFKITERFC